MPGGVFVSYRRDDASHVAGRMADALGARIGRENVFVDVDSVAPGEDFVRKIETTIRGSETFLAVMGTGWLNAATPQGQRRIDLEGDFIRLEVRSAIAAGLRVIPVLVDGATMPRAEDLPEDIRQLVRHNAVFISHTTFLRDMSALLEQLYPASAAPTPAKSGNRLIKSLALPVGAGVMVLAVLAMALWPKGPAGLAGLTSSISLAEAKTGEGKQYFLETRFVAERGPGGQLSIRAVLPYRERLKEEHRIDGLKFVSSPPILPGLPTLTVQVANSRLTPITINEVQIEVMKARPDKSALPVLREFQEDYQKVILINNGWGELEAPKLTIKAWGLPETDRQTSMKVWKNDIVSEQPCAQPSGLVDVDPLVVSATPNERGGVFELGGKIPAAFAKEVFVCAVGQLSYVSDGKPETLDVRTRVSNERPTQVAASPIIETYDLYLDPDREGYVAVVPLLRPIAAGATDTIAIRVYSDKSTTFELRQTVRTSTGEIIPGEALSLEVFAPRYVDAPYMQAPGAWALVPEEDLRAVDKAGLISSATFDPQGIDGMRVVLSGKADEATCAKVRGELGPAILKRLGAREMGVSAAGSNGACPF